MLQVMAEPDARDWTALPPDGTFPSGTAKYEKRAIAVEIPIRLEQGKTGWRFLGDFVRMIRTIRPQVIVGFVFDGAGGGLLLRSLLADNPIAAVILHVD